MELEHIMFTGTMDTGGIPVDLYHCVAIAIFIPLRINVHPNIILFPISVEDFLGN